MASEKLCVLLTGANGQVGRALMKNKPDFVQLVACTHDNLDITQDRFVQEFITYVKPDIILNAAAYTQVDQAQIDFEMAYLVNKHAVCNLAQVACQCDIPLVHISTDYVFDGASTTPYKETQEPHPINVYGWSKLEGERAALDVHEKILVVRTSTVFDLQAKNFATSILQNVGRKKVLQVVDDLISCPTPAKHLASALWQLVGQYLDSKHLPWGILHYAGERAYSRYEWAKELVAIFCAKKNIMPDIEIQPCSLSCYPTLAQRPQYSVLNCQKIKDLCNICCGEWQDVFDDDSMLI